MRNWIRVGFGVIVLCLLTLPAIANQPDADEDDEQRVQFSGIWGTYSASGKSVSRRDPDIAFIWHNRSPLQQLPPGPFQVSWRGKLFIRSPGKYRFHAHLQGESEITLNGQKVLTSSVKQEDSAQWVTGPEVEFEYGQHQFEVTFKSSTEKSRIKLYWSSDSFAFEPIPAGMYLMQEAHPQHDLENRGRELFTAHRCNRCHRRENDPLSPAGPDLSHVSVGLQPNWIERWLTGGQRGSAHSWMPEFGFTNDEARAVEAFLRDQSTEVKLPGKSGPETNPAELAKAGRKLLHTTGCLACHTYGPVGSKTPFGGGDLSAVGDKRTASWLRLWLTDPKQLNADHHMPVFSWKWDNKQGELTEIVTFLASSHATIAVPGAPAPASPTTKEMVDQGRQLVQQARCAACHRLNGIAAVEKTNLSNLEQGRADSRNSCLQSTPDRAHWRPAYPGADSEAIKAYLQQRAGTLTPEGSVERGQRLLAWNNCLQCHPRDGVRGLAAQTTALNQVLPELAGQGPTLIPPDLNAVGDKLQDQALGDAVGGDFSKSRLPWLQVRMPKFAHTQEDRRTLSEFFIAHDRIQAPPLELVSSPEIPQGEKRPTALVVGHSLLGSHGFSCIACHQVGKYQPRDVALGTRGSDLLQIGKRMRREYFFRWTRSPIRIIPDMEMPGYEQPLPDLLGGKIESQLAALWEALHDPNSNRPLDATSLQQVFTVGRDEPARIVRDVFVFRPTGSKEKESYIPRAFAVGFNSKHNVLFDLDRMELRDWWWGDLARQRTEGKSWNWEAAGVRLVNDMTARWPEICFLQELPSGEALLAPVPAAGAVGRLLEYGPAGADGVRLVYRLNVPDPHSLQTVGSFLDVTEEWRPIGNTAAEPVTGWLRKISTTTLKDLSPVFVRRDYAEGLGSSGVNFPAKSSLRWQLPKGPYVNPAPEIALLIPDGSGKLTGTFHYTSITNAIVPSTPLPASPNSTKQEFATVPGYLATRLPLPHSIMPTALTWMKDGKLAFASLKGHVYTAKDTDGDGLEDQLTVFEEGLAAPYGVISDPTDGSLIVSHKPELLRLVDTDGDGRADLRRVFSTGWGYNDNYHDWTCGIVRDSKGNLYVGLGSDYTQSKRPVEQQKWRGKILRIDPAGQPTPIASGLRYPTGLAMTPDDDLLVSDNQGEQNVFNELNHIVEGAKYGVPSREDPKDDVPASRPAIQIPHPWTRSINGIFFIPRDAKFAADKSEPHPFAGHGIGCEYDTRFLIRFSLQKVGDTMQGAVYPFSLEKVPTTQPNFEGTLSGGVSPKGDIYIGCIHDSGWLGGLNVGSLVRLQSTGLLPLGIRELRATPQGFQIDFTGPVDREAAAAVGSYTISAYTREWQGTYATPDSNRHEVKISSVSVSEDGRQVTLQTDPLRVGYVYEVTCGKIGLDREISLWPTIGHYTVNRVPVEK